MAFQYKEKSKLIQTRKEDLGWRTITGTISREPDARISARGTPYWKARLQVSKGAETDAPKVVEVIAFGDLAARCSEAIREPGVIITVRGVLQKEYCVVREEGAQLRQQHSRYTLLAWKLTLRPGSAVPVVLGP